VRVLHDVQESDAVATTVGLLPLSYTYAFVNQWLWAHVMNRVYVPTAGLTNPAELYRILEGASAVMLCLVGVQVPLLLAHFADAIFPGVIRVHFAGGRFPQERLPEVRVLFPNASVYNNYGCAEALPRLTVRKATAPAEAANVGRPLPGVELRVNDPDAIHFRSPYAAVGVVEGEAFIPIGAEDWVPSGDLGFLNADGSWTLLGRPGEVFKRHGEKVSLLALTTTVTSAWSGQHAFYRERDPSGEEGCVLAIAPMATAIEIRSVLSALRRNHPRSHWPLRIESLPVLPMLDNGKVDIRSIITVGSKCVLWKQHI
jgi:acyl-CoA synthetase (AMP-forming)/AMP-acid ligase II